MSFIRAPSIERVGTGGGSFRIQREADRGEAGRSAGARLSPGTALRSPEPGMVSGTDHRNREKEMKNPEIEVKPGKFSKIYCFYRVFDLTNRFPGVHYFS